jgi:hypothetical protein
MMAIKMGFVKRIPAFADGMSDGQIRMIGTKHETTKEPAYPEAGILARFGRIDRSVERSPCARRCRRSDARKR